MKLDEVFENLFEMPQLRAYDKDSDEYVKANSKGNPSKWLDSDIISKRFVKIGTFNLGKGKVLESYFNPKILIGNVSETLYNRGTNYVDRTQAVICSISFKMHPTIESLPPSLNTQKFLQVDNVGTIDKYKSIGLAHHLYAALIDHGYAIISDEIQYNGGKKLWKKIAKNNKKYAYVVYILDVQRNELYCDDNGIPIEYDASNIADDRIWKPTPIGKYFLLVAVGTSHG